MPKFQMLFLSSLLEGESHLFLLEFTEFPFFWFLSNLWYLLVAEHTSHASRTYQGPKISHVCSVAAESLTLVGDSYNKILQLLNLIS